MEENAKGERKMREISARQITETVKRLCIEANCYLPEDVKACIGNCKNCVWGYKRF